MEQGEILKYCDLMEEIKRRTEVIVASKSGLVAVLFKATTIELVSANQTPRSA